MTLSQWQKCQSANHAKYHHGVSTSDGDFSRGYRTKTLLGMQTICLHISQIVKAVYATGDKTERGKRHKRGPKVFWLQQVVAEEYRCKDKDVLQPLQRT
jgi:hypothetical protein